MKAARNIIIAVIVLLLGAYGGAFLLPRTAHVERSMNIDASPEFLFGMMNDLREFNRWSPWYDIDPETEYEFSGADVGVGQKMSWRSDHPEVGSGTQTIVASELNRMVRTELDFGPQGTAIAEYRIDPGMSSSKVTWTLDSDLGDSVLMRYMGLVLDGMVGAQYEQGLAKLKSIAEAEG